MGITMKDIAREAGVSITTVSKIINNKDMNISEQTRQRVLEIAKRENYTPNAMAKSLRAKTSNFIGVILPDITNPFFSTIVRGVEDTAKRYGFGVVFCNTDNNPQREAECFGFLNSRMVDGVIFTRSLLAGNGDNVLENDLPIVIIDRDTEIPNATVGKVFVDTVSAVHEATGLLIQEGCRKIAYISALHHLERDRYGGFLTALHDHGMECDSQLVFRGEYNVETGMQGIETILKYALPDGVVCGNDLIATGVLSVLNAKGYRIPQEVRVIGMDDIYMSQFLSPPLTTIRQPAYEIGASAAKMIADYIMLGKPLYAKQLSYEIIHRESV